MQVVTYNIQYGRGRDGRSDLERTAAALAGADLIALQEVERHFPRSGMIDQPAALAEMFPGHYWVFAPGIDLHGDMPSADGRVDNRRRQFGTMLLSRRPLLSTRAHLLPKRPVLARLTDQACALEAVIDSAAGPLRVYSIHLTHIDPLLRRAQVEALLDIHRRAPAEGGAWCGEEAGRESWTLGLPPPMPGQALLMGDFNLNPDSPEYSILAGPMDPHVGRLAYADGFLDAWVAAGHGELEGVTFKAAASSRGRDLRIDYCFVSAVLADRIRGAWIDDDATASDHQPMWTELDL